VSRRLPEIKFCNACGAQVAFRIPEGDNVPRAVCVSCGTIQYQNPKVVVGSIPEWEGRILMCRRAIEPRHGLWTLPAGFMENGETATQGAAREAMEEANARIEVQQLYTLFSVPHISQVYVFFRARLLDSDVSPGAESLEVKLVLPAEIPWDQLAFMSVRNTLRHYIADRERGIFESRHGDILPPQR
jgi:ADP-ribose pyrophosphatase YjhB (NUDIX family)